MEKLIYRSFIGYRYLVQFGFNALNTILIILKMPMDLQNKLIKLCSWDTLFPGPLSLWTCKNFGPLRAPDYTASQSAPAICSHLRDRFTSVPEHGTVNGTGSGSGTDDHFPPFTIVNCIYSAPLQKQK